MGKSAGALRREFGREPLFPARRRLGREHPGHPSRVCSVGARANEPQRRDERSAAEPQPEPRNTRNTRNEGHKLCRFLRIPRIPRLLSLGKLLAGCEQLGLLQCREESEGEGAQTNHLSVTELHVARTGSSLWPSRLCGLMEPPSPAWTRLRGFAPKYARAKRDPSTLPSPFRKGRGGNFARSLAKQGRWTKRTVASHAACQR
jgi:hypothetical protein